MDEVLQKPAENYDPRGRLDPAGFANQVRFQMYPPPADLAPFIEHFWIIEWDDKVDPYHSDELMHRPYVDVFFSLPESGIQGTFRGKRTYVADGVGRIIGIRFRPGAFHAIWNGALADLQDRVVELAHVFPEADGSYIEHLLSLDNASAIAMLQNLIRSKRPQQDANIDLINEIILAVETNEDLQTVAAVGHAFARSDRWLQQLFQDYVGIGLKWQLQRYKLLAAAKLIRETDQPIWSSIAYDFGYSSQQHFNTHFKKVVGKTPLQYKRDLTST